MKKTDAYYLLSIDPGKMTGVAELYIYDMDKPEVNWTDEMAIKDFHNFIGPYLAEHKDSIEVVIEDFIITARTAKLSPQPWSLHLIGVVIYLCEMYDIPLTFQKPADKQFADNAKLKKIGWHHVGGGGHADDALRHCIVWLTNRHPSFAKAFLN